MAATLAEIAKRVGVHQSTVSAVLNRSRATIRVSDQTRQRILAVARELQYRPSFSAQSLAKGRTNSLGMICGDIHSPHFSELASRAMQEAEARGYHLLLSVAQWITQENNLGCLETLMGRGVDGVIAWGSGLSPQTPLYEQILRERFPLVLCSEQVGDLSSIDSDWHGGIGEAVEYLKRRGHDRVCFVGYRNGWHDPQHSPDPKRPAFIEACRRHAVEPREIYMTKLSDLEEAEAMGAAMADARPSETAFLVYSDYTAFGFCRGLLNRGVRVPQDVSVVGMDGTRMGQYYHPALTTIAQDRELIVAEAIDMTLRMIENQEEPGRRVILPTRLIVRESA
ncbi:MAG: LacI family transcriptional regulator [Phycisphaerae bacterium]|nr:LacI family transcriptional regulator [Phycisphaerae bacterium]